MAAKRRVIIVAAVLSTALSVAAAHAQTTPPDPLAPGAAAQSAPSEEPGADKAGAEKPEPASKPAHRRHVRPKPHPRHEAATLTVVVHNERSVGLVDLMVGPAGDANLKKVAGPLAFGRKTVIHIKRAKDCLYDIHGHFADEADTDQQGVDLCKDKKINLTD